MTFSERKLIIENLKYVDEVIDFEDDEIGSCIHALEKVKDIYEEDEIYFANGGDRDKKNINLVDGTCNECEVPLFI